MYLQGILSCLPTSCSQDSIRKGPHCQKKKDIEDKYVGDDKKRTLMSIYFKWWGEGVGGLAECC